MSGCIRGVDVSSWQHADGESIDWEEVAREGYRFAIIKATQGVRYLNPWLDRDLEDAFAAGLLVGAYHYFEPGAGAAEQAGFFTGSLIGKPLEVGTWLDWECYAPDPYQYGMQLQDWFGEARKARPEVGIYLAADWAEALKGNDVLKGRLWLRNAYTPEPGTAFLWQAVETASVAGINGPVSVNVLSNPRGVDLPTSPPPRPSAATARPVRPKVDAPDEEAGPTSAEAEDLTVDGDATG